MPIEHIAFPLPVVVNGYACLDGAEIQLAQKDIDPAHPVSVGTPPAPPTPAQDEQPARVISYGPGTVRRAETAKATTYSITA